MIAAIKALCRRLTESKLAMRFLRGATWSIFGSVVAQVTNLASMIFVARLLGKVIYGEMVLIQTTLTMFGTFAGFGIGATAVRYVAALKIKEKQRLGHILALCDRGVLFFGLIISLTIALFSPQLSTSVLNSPSLATPLRIAALTVLFTTMDGYQKSTLVGFESMRAFAVSAILGAMASMPIMIVSAGNHGLYGVAFAMSAGAFMQAVISRVCVNNSLRREGVIIRTRGCLKELPILWDFALPALLAGAMVTPAHWICQAMLANTRNGLAEVAILGVAMQWFNAVMFLPNLSGKTITPMLTEYVAGGSHNNSKKIIMLSVVANFIISLPIVITISALSPWILSAYGSSFLSGKFTLIIAVFTAMLAAVMTPIGNLLAAHSKMWTGLTMNLGWFVSYTSVSFFVIHLGSIGVVGAMAVAYILHSGWVFLWATRKLQR